MQAPSSYNPLPNVHATFVMSPPTPRRLEPHRHPTHNLGTNASVRREKGVLFVSTIS